MSVQYKYLAFISYKREDEKWAKWLQHKLEHYKFPTSVRKSNPTLPDRVRPIFKDTTDLAGGVLEKTIKEALDASKYLIVICSPRAAQSIWVCKEVQEFIDLGREEYIIPFIVDGEPNSSNISTECFPQNLRDLSGKRELLGININEMGRDAAAIKVVARMFKIRFDVIWRRYERERRRKLWIIVVVSSIFVMCSLGIGLYVFRMNIELERNIYQMKINQSRAITEKVNNSLEHLGVFRAADILLEVAPDIYYNQDWPYTFEVEDALRKLWQTYNGSQPYASDVLIGHNDYVQAVSYSPDGRFLASGGYDETIRVWDLQTGQIMALPIKSSFGYITELTWSPDGKYLVSGSSYGAVQLWNVVSGELLNEYYPERWGGEGISTITCSPGGNYVSFGRVVNFNLDDKRRSVYVWDIEKNELMYELKGHIGSIEALAFSSDERYIASSSDEEECLRIWDISCGKEVAIFSSKYGRIISVAFSPDNKHIIGVTENGCVLEWNIGTRSLITETISEYHGSVASTSFSNNTLLLFYSDGVVLKFNSATNEYELVCNLRTHLNVLDSYMPGGMVACAENQGDIKVWNINTNSHAAGMFMEGDKYELIEYHSDGRLYAYTIDNSVLKILDLQTGSWSIPYLEGKNMNIHSIHDTPDERYKIAECSGRVIRLFDIFNDCEVCSFVCPQTDDVGDIALSYDGKYLAVGCNRVVVLYNITNGTYEIISDIDIGHINAICFTQCGNIVYGGGFSRAEKSLDNVFLHILTKEGRKEMAGHRFEIDNLCLSADGKYIASASFTDIRLWDTETGMQIGKAMNVGNVQSLCFSPDGKYLVSSSGALDHQEGSLCLWDVRQQQQLGNPLLIHNDEGGQVTFNPEGDEIVYSSPSGGLIKIPFASFDKITADFHKLLLKRELSETERQDYFLGEISSD